MYSKFDYKPSINFYNTTLNKYFSKGSELYSQHEKEVQDCLSQYITEEGIINGSDLKEHWFTISDKDIFISHSHKDINKVKAFAGWIYETFGLNSFIDSCSWGYCDELLRKIDNKYCYNKKTKTYNYSLRNYTTSHVHMMLSTALSEMMNKTECVIFFNTPNSINMKDELERIKKKESTNSHWIYYELSMMTLLKKNDPTRKLALTEHYAQHSDSNFAMEYDVSELLKGIAKLEDKDLLSWEKEYCDIYNDRSKENALDILYEIVFPKKTPIF